MVKKDFYNIRQFACENFFAWENGEDFDWLKKEWNKFEPLLKNEKEVEDFILSLADIYNSFCHESYFAKITDEDVKKYDWIIEDTKPNPELPESRIKKERIQSYFDKTLDILLEVYHCPEEIARQFVTIAISFQLPHEDGIKYIFSLFKNKWNPDEDIVPIF